MYFYFVRFWLNEHLKFTAMSKGLLEIILIMVVAIPIGIATIRFYFKGSILYYMGTLKIGRAHV